MLSNSVSEAIRIELHQNHTNVTFRPTHSRHTRIINLDAPRKPSSISVVLHCLIKERQPDIERVQALADISRSALCCHSDETRAPVANPPNCAQLDGNPYHSPNLHPVPCSSVGMWQGTDKRDTQTAVTNIHFASATPDAKCKKGKGKASHTRHRALGPELIPVYRQSACR